jgi:hypothetical protein
LDWRLNRSFQPSKFRSVPTLTTASPALRSARVPAPTPAASITWVTPPVTVKRARSHESVTVTGTPGPTVPV